MSREVSPDQLALLVVPDTFTRAVETDRHVWAGICDAAIERLAATGEEFQAIDLALRCGVADPPHPNHWGLRFHAARRSGLIRIVRYEPSRRRTVAGSAVAVWVGTQPQPLTRPRKAASVDLRAESEAA